MEGQIKNFVNAKLQDLEGCHEGLGVLLHTELFSGQEFASPIRFMNYTILPPNTSIGIHQHKNDEEIYIILEGVGIMHLDGQEYAVKTGDVIRNKPFGTHGLKNTGNNQMKILVFENAVVE
jgi:quercetin dioxygenase-like cupin family protein